MQDDAPDLPAAYLREYLRERRIEVTVKRLPDGRYRVTSGDARVTLAGPSDGSALLWARAAADEAALAFRAC